jgi:predicted DNA-binding protein
MTIIKTNKKERVAVNMRMPIELSERINNVLDRVKTYQSINKTSLIFDAIERGLDSIEHDLMNQAKQ